MSNRTETLELLFKLNVQGSESLERLAASVAKINNSAMAGNPEIAKLEREVEQLGRAMSGVSTKVDATGQSFSGLAAKIQSGATNPMGEAKQAAIGFFESLGKGPALIAGVTLALGAAGKGMFDLVSNYGRAAEETLNLADRLGIGARAAEELQIQAGIAGVNIGSLEGASRLLAAALEDQSGAGEKTATAIRKMGVSTVTSTGDQREMGKVLLDVLAALSRIPNDAERALAAQQTLGKGAAKELQPLIKSYSDLQAVTAKFGSSLDENMTKQLAAADDAIDKLSASWDKFWKSIAANAAPFVTKIIVDVTTVINGRREAAMIDPNDPKSIERALSNAAPGSVPSFDSKQSFLDATVGFSNRQLLASGFRNGQAGTVDGQRKRLQQVQKETAELSAKLGSGDLAPDAFKSNKAAFDKLEAEGRQLEASIKAAADRKSLLSKLADLEKQGRKAGLSDLQKLNVDGEELLKELGPGYAEQVMRIYGPQQFEAMKKIVAEGHKQVAEQGKKLQESQDKDLENQSKSFIETRKKWIEDDGKELKVLQDQLTLLYGADAAKLERNAGFAVSRSKALAGPGSELSQVEESFKIRIGLAKELYDLAMKRADAETDAGKQTIDLLKAKAEFEKSTDEARMSRELEIYELRKKGLEDYRNAAGRVWDAAKAGGGGISDFLTGQLDILQRQLFVNASGKTFQKAGGFLGKIGAASGIPPDLLAGTILDPQNAKIDQATTDNTRETRENTKAIRGLTRSLTGSSAGTEAGLESLVPGFLGVTPSDLLVSDGHGLTGQGGILDKIGLGKKLFSDSTRSGFKDFASGFGGVFAGAGLSGLKAGTSSTVYDEMGQASSVYMPSSMASRVGAGVGIAGAVAGGVFGVYQGIQEGGARGTVTAIGSAAGAAAALSPEPISKAILMSIALGASLVKGLFGDPKQQRAEELDALIKERSYKAPAAIDRLFDVGTGQDVEYDYRGRMRQGPVINFVVNAVDRRSVEQLFLENSSGIGQALLKEINLGNPTGLGIQQAVLGT